MNDASSTLVQVECGAFGRIGDGKWITLKSTTVVAESGAATRTLNFGGGIIIELHRYRLNGVDVVDVLEQKCSNGKR